MSHLVNKNVYSWSAADVHDWLLSLRTESGSPKLPKHIPALFRNVGVNGERLMSLDASTGSSLLKSHPYEIARLDVRLTILHAIRELKKAWNLQSRAYVGGAPSIKAPGKGGMDITLNFRRGMEEYISSTSPWKAEAFAPDGWVDPGEASRGAPTASLQLEFIYGCNQAKQQGNLNINVVGELIYAISSVVVVLNKETRTQRFFRKHSKKITCFNIDHQLVRVVSCSVGQKNQIFVWDSQNMMQLGSLEVTGEKVSSVEKYYFVSTQFSPRDDMVVAIDCSWDIFVWKWEEGALVAKASSGKSVIFELKFNPFISKNDPPMFATVGGSCVRFWTVAEKELTSRYGVVGDVGTLQTACSVAFLDRAHAVSGMQDGSIYLWKTSAVIHNLTGAHSKPIMQLVCREDLIYSGSRDGVVRLWTFSLAQKGAGREFLTLVGSINCREMMQKIHLKQETEKLPSPASPQVHFPTNTEGSKGLHARPVSISSLVVRLSEESLFATITVGLDSNEVYQVSLHKGGSVMADCECVISAHVNTPIAVCIHPSRPIFATSGSDGTLRLWDLETKRIINRHVVCRIGGAPADIQHTASCLDISPGENEHLCAGLTNGILKIFGFSASGLQELFTLRELGSSDVRVVKYSSDGLKLAVANSENLIEIYSKQDFSNYVFSTRKQLVVSGHVTNIDWSRCSSFLQISTSNFELVFLEVDQCKVVGSKTSVRNSDWDTQHCPIGWPMVGLYSREIQDHHITSVDRSFDDLILAGCNTNKIIMSSYPSLENTDMKVFDTYSTSVHMLRCAGSRSSHLELREKDSVVAVMAEEFCVAQFQLLRSQKQDSSNQEKLSVSKGVLGAELQSLMEKCQMYPEDVLPSRGITDFEEANNDLPTINSGQVNENEWMKDKDLSVTFIHGYRGFDCRKNVFCVEKGCIVYFSGKLCVVYNLDKEKQLIYTQHKRDVHCISVVETKHRIKERDDYITADRDHHMLVASGESGSEGAVHVWRTLDAHRFSLLQHDHSVSRLSFCMKRYLLTLGGHVADDTVSMWDWVRMERIAVARVKDGAPCWELAANPFYDEGEEGSDMEVICGASCGMADVSFWSLKLVRQETKVEASLTEQKGKIRHKADGEDPVFATCAVFVNRKVMVTGMSDGDVLVWYGLKTNNRIRRLHAGGVFEVSLQENIIYTGGKDGMIKTWDVNTLMVSTASPESNVPYTRGETNGSCLRIICPVIRDDGLHLVLGFSNNELIDLEMSRFGIIKLITCSHTQIVQPSEVSQNWKFTLMDPTDHDLERLQDLAAQSTFIIYSNRSKIDPDIGRQNQGSAPRAWHEFTSSSTDRKVKGFLQIAQGIEIDKLKSFLPNANFEVSRESPILSASDISLQCGPYDKLFQSGHLQSIRKPDSYDLYRLFGFPHTVLVVHPSDLQCVTAGSDRAVMRWDLRSRSKKPLIARKMLNEYVICADWAPEGMHIALGTMQGNVLLVDSASLNIIQELRTNLNFVTSVRFSPNNQFAAFGVVRMEHADCKKITKIITGGIFTSLSTHGSLSEETTHLPSVVTAGYITNIDWSTGGMYLRTKTVSSEVIHWSCNPPQILMPSVEGLDLSQPDSVGTDSRSLWEGFKTWLDDPSSRSGWSSMSSEPYEQNLVEEVFHGKATVTAQSDPNLKISLLGDEKGHIFLCPSLDVKQTDKSRIMATSPSHAGKVGSVVFTSEAIASDEMILSIGHHDLTMYCWKIVLDAEAFMALKTSAVTKIQALYRGFRVRKRIAEERRRAEEERLAQLKLLEEQRAQEEKMAFERMLSMFTKNKQQKSSLDGMKSQIVKNLTDQTLSLSNLLQNEGLYMRESFLQDLHDLLQNQRNAVELLQERKFFEVEFSVTCQDPSFCYSEVMHEKFKRHVASVTSRDLSRVFYEIVDLRARWIVVKLRIICNDRDDAEHLINQLSENGDALLLGDGFPPLELKDSPALIDHTHEKFINRKMTLHILSAIDLVVPNEKAEMSFLIKTGADLLKGDKAKVNSGKAIWEKRFMIDLNKAFFDAGLNFSFFIYSSNAESSAFGNADFRSNEISKALEILGNHGNKPEVVTCEIRDLKDEQTLGEVQMKFEILEDKQFSSLVITIISVVNLPKMDTFGKCDAFCSIAWQGKTYKTRVIPNSYEAKWGEQFQLPLGTNKDLPQDLLLEIFDDNKIGKAQHVGQLCIGKDELGNLTKGQQENIQEIERQIVDKSGAPVQGHNKEKTLLKLKLAKQVTQKGKGQHQGASGRLILHLLRAQHLPKMDTMGTCDAYCVINYSGEERKSSVKKNTYSPDWGERLDFEVEGGGEVKEMTVDVWDYDMVGSNDKVGSVRISAAELRACLRSGEARRFEIKDENNKAVVGHDKQKAEISLRFEKEGELEIEPQAGDEEAIAALTRRARLEVVVESARHLPKMDTMGTCDAYCVINYSGEERKSSVKKNTYSPDWGERLDFEVEGGGEVKEMVAEVWDYNIIGSNDKVGSVRISADFLQGLYDRGNGTSETKDFQLYKKEKLVLGKDKQETILTLTFRIIG